MSFKPSAGTFLVVALCTAFLGGLGVLAYLRHQAAKVAPPPVQSIRDPAETARELSAQMQDILSAKVKGGDLSLLLPDAKKLADANPKCFEAQLVLGQLYMAGKNYTLAYAPVHAALELRPLGQELTKLLGTLAANTDRPKEAEALYRHALAKAVRGHDRAVVHAMLGGLLRSEGNLAEADAQYGEAVADDATLVLAHVARADLALAQHKPEDALARVEEGEAWADGTAADTTPFTVMKARILLAQGKPDEGYRLLMTGLSAPQQLRLDAAAALAQIWDAQGRPGLAAAHYDSVVAALEAPPPADAKPDPNAAAVKEEELKAAKAEAAKWWEKAKGNAQTEAK